MKHLLALSLLAAAALSPAVAAKKEAAAPVEMIMRIAAQGVAEPDAAALFISLAETGAKKAAAEAALKKRMEAVTKELTALGIAAKDIHAGEISVIEIDSADDAAMGAMDAVATAGVAVKGTFPSVKRKLPANSFKASASLSMVIYDLKNLPGAKAIEGKYTEDRSYPRGMRTKYFMSDATKSHQAAIDNALTRAKADGEALAEKMGYRIVRIAKVSTAKAPVNIPDIADILRTLNTNDNEESEYSRVSQSSYATVEIDYVVVAK